MTNIPKKLEDTKWQDTFFAIEDLVNKINEIIDYLQAKEEASKGECGWARRLKEAEEQDKIDSEKMIKAGLLPKGCINPRNYARVMQEMAESTAYNPPEHEEQGEPEMMKMSDVAKNFVSKEKIKSLIKQYRDDGSFKKSEFRSGWEAGMDVIESLVESLGLGD